MNPIPYNNLFDIDGLRQAVIEADATIAQFDKNASEGFDILNAQVVNLKKELQGLGVTLNQPIKLIDDAGQEQVRQLSQQVATLTAQYKQQQLTIDALNASLTSNKAAVADAKLQALQYTAALKAEQLNTQDVKTQIAEQTLALKQLSLANKQAANDVNTLISPYKALSKQLTDTRNAAKDIAVTQGLNSPEFKEAQTNVINLDSQLKQIDSTLGQSQRNVGAYGNAFTKSFGAIRQLAYILPGIGIAGIFNYAGEAIITVVSNLDLFNQKLSISQIGIKAFKDALSGTEYAKAAEEITQLGVNLELVKDGFLDKDKVIDEYNNSIGTVTGKVDTLNEAEKGYIANSQKYIQATLAKAAANIILADAAKDAADTAIKNQKLQDELNGQNTATNAGINFSGGLQAPSATQGLNDYKDRRKRIQQEIIDNNKNFDDQQKKRIAQLAQLDKTLAALSGGSSGGVDNNTVSSITQLQNQIAIDKIEKDKQTQQAIIDNEKASYSARLSAITQFQKDEQAIAALNQKTALTQQNLSNLEKTKINDDYQKSYTQAIENANQQRQTINDKASAQDLEHLKNNLQAQKDAAKLILSNPDATVDQKQSALDSSNSASIGIINATYDAQVKAAGNVKEALVLAKDEQNKALLQLSIDYQNENNKILEDGYNTQIKNAKDHDAKVLQLAQESIDALNNALAQRSQDTEQDRADSEKALTEQYAQGLISEKNYNEAIRSIDNQAQQEKLEDELKTAQAIVAIRQNFAGTKEGDKQLQQALDTVAKLKLALTNLGIKFYADDAKTDVEALKEVVDELQKSASIVGNLFGNSGLGSLFGDLGKDLVNGFGKDGFAQIAQLGIDATDAYTTYSINASKARQKAYEDEMQHDLDLAGNNTDAKNAIQANYNKKIADEQNKQAKLQRAQAVVDIAINTAVAVSKAAAVTGPLAFLLIPSLIALGALEEAIVLSQPIPQYAKGRTGGPAEYAEVNERGPEAIGQKGRYRIFNRGMRGIVRLNAGDEVKTATDTDMLMANGMLRRDNQYVQTASNSKLYYDTYVMTASRSSGIDYDQMAGAVANGVSGLPVTEHNWNERGYQRNLRIKNTRILGINKRNRF